MADTWRWADVPILIRAGKCLPVTATEVTVRFRRPPRDIFGLAPLPPSNELRFRVWPETQGCLTLSGKKPGQEAKACSRGTRGVSETLSEGAADEHREMVAAEARNNGADAVLEAAAPGRRA